MCNAFSEEGSSHPGLGSWKVATNGTFEVDENLKLHFFREVCDTFSLE